MGVFARIHDGEKGSMQPTKHENLTCNQQNGQNIRMKSLQFYPLATKIAIENRHV